LRHCCNFSEPERWNGTTALDRDDQLIVKTRACTGGWPGVLYEGLAG
jgi:hypothetical protein